MKKFLAVLLIGPAAVITQPAIAQQAPNLGREWTSIEIVLSVSVLIFTLVLIGIEAAIIVKSRKNWAPKSITKLIGLTLLISITVLLVVAGYDQDQIAPVTGLLGVIAGYLLGNNEAGQSASRQTPADN